MSELRLVPAAIVVWSCTLAVLITRQPWFSLGILAVTLAATCYVRAHGQAMTTTVLGAAATVVSYIRARSADRADIGPYAAARISGAGRETDFGQWVYSVQLSGVPGEVTMISSEPPAPVGSTIAASISVQDSERVALVPVLLKAHHVAVVEQAQGFAKFAHDVKAGFRQVVQASVGESSQGLLPGMVLGDTGLQDANERQMYIDAGLSHLSAVSGSNVTIITVTALLLARLATLGPRIQVGAAAVALAGFVMLVGLEPSVLRAAVTGVVGMLAVLGSAQMEPLHGLSLATISLLLWDSSLAASYGFALSVAATAGIVALFPLLYRGLANPWLPDIFNRALAVAIAADVVTLPLVALMAGRVPTVSILANVLVAPVVAPVTILGLVAIVLMPVGLAPLVLRCAEPFTWWIHTVARYLTSWEHASVNTGVIGASLAAGWIVWFVHTRRLHWLLVASLLAGGVAVAH